MVDSDDVLQLRVHPSGPPLPVRPAALRDVPVEPGAVVLVIAHRPRGQGQEAAVDTLVHEPGDAPSARLDRGGQSASASQTVVSP